jgi:cell division protease FtsH
VTRPEDGRNPGWRAWIRPGWRLRFVLVVLVLLALNAYISSRVTEPEPPTEISYSFFREQLESRNVAEITSIGDKIDGELRRPVRYPRGARTTVREFETFRPGFAEDDPLEALLDQGVEVSADQPSGRPLWQVALVSFGPTFLFVALLVLVWRRFGRSGGMLGLGRSSARRYEAGLGRTTFEDVAGIDDAKEELVEIVDFLRDPERYRRLGAAIPRGILLSGPPGTGKTLLARAVAGEADVPFYSLSGSEFIELVVGVGASRVRDLFRQAKETAPAIIFIDELDAVGRARGAAGGFSGGGDHEREQTLNQILTEMDGFSGSEGVIVLASTNRSEILDSALLRPGRFDRRVVVSAPDQSGRRAIIRIHTRAVPLDDDVDIGHVAASTPGMVGADLKNLVNEAALQAARHGRDSVTARDFSTALEKIVLGTERQITISEDERRRTAYHEAGHALLGMLEPGADPIRKVSIVPRGTSMGSTFQSPDIDRYGYSAAYLKGKIIGALGGRAAEEIIYGDVTSGAESDLEVVTRIARLMVGRWGMSESVGLVSVLPAPGQTYIGGRNDGPSEGTRKLVDAEVRRVIDECYSIALGKLHDNVERLERLAEALLERETLDADESYEVAGILPPSRNGDGDLGAAQPQHDGRPAPASLRVGNDT